MTEAFYFLLGWTVGGMLRRLEVWNIRREDRKRWTQLGPPPDTPEMTEEELAEDREIAKLQEVLATGQKPDGVP